LLFESRFQQQPAPLPSLLRAHAALAAALCADCVIKLCVQPIVGPSAAPETPQQAEKDFEQVSDCQSKLGSALFAVHNLPMLLLQAEKDFEQVADFLHEALELAKSVQTQHGKLLKDFNRCAPLPRLASACCSLLQCVPLLGCGCPLCARSGDCAPAQARCAFSFLLVIWRCKDYS